MEEEITRGNLDISLFLALWSIRGGDLERLIVRADVVSVAGAEFANNDQRKFRVIMFLSQFAQIVTSISTGK